LKEDSDRDDVTSGGRLFTFLLLQWEKLGRQWFEGESVVQPVLTSMMNIGVVDPEVQQPAVGRQPSRPPRIRGDTGTLTRHACM